MKKIILLLCMAFGIKSAIADCAMNGMQFFPKQKEIGLNSMFIIQGYSYSQKTIVSFKNRTVYLENENGELIELNLQELLKGQMGLTQAVFKPSKELQPNTTYFLKYSNQTKKEDYQMLRYNSKKKKREKVFWKTIDSESNEICIPSLNFEFEKTEVVYYGCGPSANAIFNVENDSKSEIWYKTEVVEIATNKKTFFYISEWNGKLSVGHGMCSGAFVFKKKGKYKARFSPMTCDGKLLRKTNWSTFESPFAKDDNPFGY